MIRGKYSAIRSAEADDAAVLKTFYDPSRPRSCLLDMRRELLLPSLDELREVLGQKEQGKPIFYAVENLTGEVRGFCSMRGQSLESTYGEFVVVLDDADLDTPLAVEVFQFLANQAFVRMRFNKILTHCLDSEQEYRAYLLRHGFKSDGVQRDVTFMLGRWHNLEAFSLFAADAVIEDLE